MSFPGLPNSQLFAEQTQFNTLTTAVENFINSHYDFYRTHAALIDTKINNPTRFSKTEEQKQIILHTPGLPSSEDTLEIYFIEKKIPTITDDEDLELELVHSKNRQEQTPENTPPDIDLDIEELHTPSYI